MLNFECSKGDYGGKFNGRFVLRAWPKNDPLKVSSVFQLENTPATSVFEHEVTAHEWIHWLIHRKSSFGTETVGRRFRARDAFLTNFATIRPNYSAVISYYQQRAAFFAASFKTHEDIAKRLTDLAMVQKKLLTLGKSDFELIKFSDNKSLEFARFIGCIDGFTVRKIDRLQGSIATNEIGFQDYAVDSQGVTRIREFGAGGYTGGLTNGAFETGNQSGNSPMVWLKALRRRFNREGKFGGLNKKQMAVWMLIRLSSQTQAFRRLAVKGVEPLNVKLQAADEARFILRYVRDTKTIATTLLDAIEDCMNANPNDIDQSLVTRLSHFDECILYFSYLHGN